MVWVCSKNAALILANDPLNGERSASAAKLWLEYVIWFQLSLISSLTPLPSNCVRGALINMWFVGALGNASKPDIGLIA